MAITFSLGPNPYWNILNKQGTAAGGAKMYTYRSDNKTTPKAVYQDSGGTVAWDNPITFDLNGVQGPFYWRADSTSPTDTYYIEVYDAAGLKLWELDGYLPGGSGGGGSTTTYIPILNYITNNQFIDHIDDTANPTNVTDLVIAPSNHKGFTPALLNPIVGTNGVVGPDIRFVKNNTNATDQITFPLFPLASAPLTGDVTPVDYVRYQCTNSPAGESYKCFQFPITQKIKNLSNQIMTFDLWAAVAVTPVTINAYIRQYFGSGTGASPENRVLMGAMNLTTTWQRFTIQFTVPDVALESIGTPGLQTDDDALYVQIEMPLGTPCDVFFTKPALFLGQINPDLEFVSYDQINSINSTPRTGDIRVSMESSAPRGWVAMNDGSIGNVGSTATNRANADTFFLYKTLWDGVSNTYAPVSTGRGASALDDFLANKTLTLPKSLGRALAGAGTGAGLTARTLGESLGSETISIAAMPAHDHPGSSVALGSVNIGSGTAGVVVGLNAGPTAVTVASQGGGAADGNMQPTSFMNVFIKL